MNNREIKREKGGWREGVGESARKPLFSYNGLTAIVDSIVSGVALVRAALPRRTNQARASFRNVKC